MARSAMARPEHLRAEVARLRAEARANERYAAAIEAALPAAEEYWGLSDARTRASGRERQARLRDRRRAGKG